MTYQKIFKAGWLGDTLTFFCGALLTLAFAPFNIFPLAILCPALLLAFWLKLTPKRAAFRGFLFGLGFFGTGVHWIFISMHTYGDMNIPIAALVTLLFIAVLALFPALNGYWLNRSFKENNPTKIFCAFPATWFFLEWLRGWIFTGFPWLLLGSSQINSPLKGYAPIISVYGVTLFVLLSATLVYGLVCEFYNKNYKKVYTYLLAFAIIWGFGSILSFCHWTKPLGSPIKVSLVQGNIPQSLKWSPEEVTPTLNRYLQFTAQHWDSKIIVWPESAIPIPLQDAESFVNALDSQAKLHHTSIITGIPVAAPLSNAYYNSVIMIGQGTGIYAKRRLVPFGEYVPFQSLFGKLFDLLQVPMSEFIPGPYIAKPLAVDSLKIATFICYEIAYPSQVLSKSIDTNLIVTVSNDAWFGHSVAQAQHLEIGQMRALENGRPVLFVSNNGITAVIDPNGKIQSEAPAYEPTVLTDTIQPMQGKTPLAFFNLLPIFFMAIFLYYVARKGRDLHTPKTPTDKPWAGNIFTKTKALAKKNAKK